MRNLKKVLALVIAFSMMLSVVAFAGYNDVDADADYAGAVELLSALKIFEGDENGNFNPDNTITRAEMAAIICRAMGLESAAEASKGATPFADVAASHWAAGYINMASQNGILDGYGNGNFGPEDTLTYEQAIKIIVYALGFEPMAAKKGGWSAGSVRVANEQKITEGAAANATRGNLAILMANALDTPMMDQTSYGADENYEVLNGKNDKEYRTLLTDMDIYVATGIVGQKDVDTIGFTLEEDSDDGEFDVSKKASYDFEIGESNIAAYTYQQVDAYVKKDGRDYVVVAVVASNVGETLTILSDDVDKVTSGTSYDTVEYFVDAANSSKTKEIKVKLTGIEKNKQNYTSGLATLCATPDVELVFIENTGDTTYDMLVATEYVSDRVDYVDVDRDRLALKAYGNVSFDFEDEAATIIMVDDAGNELTLADFAEDDVVAFVADAAKPSAYKNYIKVVKLANATVTGSVDETYTATSGEEYVVIDGNEYVNAYGTLEAGDEGTFYIGMTGKIIDFDGSLAGENYAYVLEGAIAKGSFSADQWQLKLLTEEDGIVTYDVKKEYHDTVVKYLAENASAFGLTATVDDPDTAADETSITEDKFLFDTATAIQKSNVARLVTFEVNSNGEIKELAVATGTPKTFDKSNDEYREDAQSINGASLEDDIVIFNVANDNVTSAYATDISYLVDEAKYTGFALRDADQEYSAMVIADLQSSFTEDTGFAVVTKVSTGKDAEKNSVTKVTYVQNEEEGVITIDDDSKIKNASATTLAQGDVIMFAADANGLVSEYVVIAKLDSNNEFVVAADFLTTGAIDNTKVASILGEDTRLVSGYIMNTKRSSTSKGEVINTGSEEVVVRGTSYKYTYNATLRNPAIDVADFMSDVDYYEVELDSEGNATGNEYASPILVRLVNDVVIDAYSTTAKVAIVSAPVVSE